MLCSTAAAADRARPDQTSDLSDNRIVTRISSGRGAHRRYATQGNRTSRWNSHDRIRNVDRYLALGYCMARRNMVLRSSPRGGKIVTGTASASG
ncbi:hypothetical protein PC116_g4474 [Phytophthora cactorum]|nr:hypothetical protein Pcac1_g14404 [Phytophthora cactorum]KAG2904281.1 hypothetical protein PC114_g11904 [Phytophthora cactorum]KAG4247763.1 hypothetical protein PC116_g4474 [Phytophthora cactorum]